METSPGIANPWKGAPIRVVESTSSTMEEAAELARAGSPTGTVIVAGFQEKGRGRVPGRRWLSPPWESLLATVVIRIRDLGHPLAELPLRAGVALCLAVEEASGTQVQIKWPNDILCEGRKLAGLLCEVRDDAALIGFGVNCTQAVFPPELADTSCSLLQMCGKSIPIFPLLRTVLSHLQGIREDAAWREKLRARLHGRGRTVSVDVLGSGKKVEGILRDVDEQGRLVLQLADGRQLALPQGELSPGR